MELKLRLTEAQQRELHAQVFRGDGNEAVAIALCGRHRNNPLHILTVQGVYAIAEEDYLVREPGRLEWHTRSLVPLLDRARQEDLGLVIVHSHPCGLAAFSPVDDRWDRKLFPPLYGWFDRIEPLASAVMTEDGKLVARAVMPDGRFVPARTVTVVGDDIRIWGHGVDELLLPEFTQRHEQILGEATARLYRALRVGVVGCSGTGTPLIEMLVCLGVGHLVLVDRGRVKVVNLNRSVGARRDEVGEFKVLAKKRHIEGRGLGTKVDAHPVDVCSREAVLALAGCDVVFGCMDTFGGRSVLNRIATHYLQPYIDLGVGLRPSKEGRLQTAQVATNYLKPGGSSLLSRGFYTPEDIAAEELLAADPDEYRRRREEGYLPGVDEVSPTVVSVNFQASTRAKNALLARLHPGFLAAPSRMSARVVDDLRTLETHVFEEGEPCGYYGQFVGKADTSPLLGIPELGAPKLPELVCTAHAAAGS